MSYDYLLRTGKSFSDSQIQRLRKYLRWSVPVDAADVQAILWNGATTPLSSNLPLLGGGNFRQVAAKMDFDCDGKRDIGVWDPPTVLGGTGTFRIYLSTKNYSTTPGQFIKLDLGGIGDIPVVGEYTGDCAADVAVYQPGGGINRNDPMDTQGYWRWCPTNTSNPALTTCEPDCGCLWHA